MRWLKWIFAYLFDCVHPHTTWPHRSPAGFAYVCCLDCGKELPYSLELMRIVDFDDHAQPQVMNPLAVHWSGNATSALVGMLLLLDPSRAIGQTSATRVLQAQPPTVEARAVSPGSCFHPVVSTTLSNAFRHL